MRKAQISPMPRLAVVLVIVMFIIAIGFDTNRAVEDKVRLETMGMIEQRINSNIYMMDAVEEGSLEMVFKKSYSLEKDEGNIFLKYSAAGSLPRVMSPSTRRTQLSPPKDIQLVKDGESDHFCITSDASDLEIAAQRCST